MNTPFFPAFRPRLAALGRHVQHLRQATLSQLEQTLGAWLPAPLLAQAKDQLNSRERIFTLRRTFWCFIWQTLNPGTPCREVVRQVQALFSLQAQKPVDEATSAYCQARGRLPLERLQQALSASALAADQRAHYRWRGHCLKVVDGSTTSLPDTPQNQAAYPQSKGQKPGCGFPLLQLVVLFSLASGSILAAVWGNKHQSELRLFRRLWSWLHRGDVLLGDRHFTDYVSLAQLCRKGVYLIGRLAANRTVDWSQGQRLGPHERLFTWTKPSGRPAYLNRRQWLALPAQITVRVIRVAVSEPGFRTRQLLLVTTLLDPRNYPAQAVAALYRRRWRLELCLRDLKTTLGMEQMRCLSPAMVHKELLCYLIAYNLIRCVMARAAQTYDVDLARVSFKGSLDTVRQYSAALAQARNAKQQRLLRQQLLRNLAFDLLPDRPGRREPRALKRRPKPYALLNRPRHLFKDIPHKNSYRSAQPSKNTIINNYLI